MAMNNELKILSSIVLLKIVCAFLSAYPWEN